jgi:hypothetical protein
MNTHHIETVRVEIVLDVDPNPDILFIWTAARAIKLVEQLRRDGLRAELISVDVDGVHHYNWKTSPPIDAGQYSSIAARTCASSNAANTG